MVGVKGNMKLEELGERGAIRIFESIYGKCEDAVLGIGDDACILEMDEEHYLVVSTDLLSRKTHFPHEMAPRKIGKYAVNACLSDIAAMGAYPLGLLFSYGLPGGADEDFIKELARGIRDASKEHGTCVLGGDTKEQNELLIVGIALGRARKGQVLRRSGARTGDLICTTGMMGSSAAGYYALIKGFKAPKRFMKAAFEPWARIKEGLAISKYATACADVSDGLAFSLHEIARASRVGFKVYEEGIPVDRELGRMAELAGVEVDELAFHKGGEYELLFTVPEEHLPAVEKEMKTLKTKLRVIGEITKHDGKLVKEDGSVVDLEPRGYEAFKSNF